MSWMTRVRKGLVKRDWARTMLTPLGHDLSPNRWIFIVGCYNSGTTLLRSLLTQHPEIDALPSEGVRLTDALPRPEDVGWHRLWCRCLNDVRLPVDEDMAPRSARIRRHWSLALPGKPANVLEKSIANTARMPFLQAGFPPAYFIYMIRNGYAVAEGIRRKAQPRRFGHDEYGDQYPIELCAEQWRASHDLVEEDSDVIDRLHTIRYEDLAANPARSLVDITDFLGLPPLPAGLDSATFDVHGVRSSIRDMNAESLARLSAADIDTIRRVSGDALDAWDYGVS